MFTDHAPAQLPDVLLAGLFPRDSGLPSDARHALDTLEAHRARGAWDALHTAGAIGTLDAFWAQLPSTARLSFGSHRATGTQFSLVPGKTIGTCDPLFSLRPCGSSRAPVTYVASETLGTRQPGVSHAALPALETSDTRGPRRALWAQSTR